MQEKEKKLKKLYEEKFQKMKEEQRKQLSNEKAEVARTKSILNLKLKKIKEMHQQGTLNTNDEEKDAIISGLQLKNE